MEGYEIRPADEGWFSHDSGQWIPRYSSAGQDTLQTAHGQGEGRVAYYNGSPVASVTWQQTPTHVMLGSAYTHPDHRGQGLFNALTEELRGAGKPVDAYAWDNPWLKNKVRDWQRQSSLRAEDLWSAWDIAASAIAHSQNGYKRAASNSWYHLTDKPDFALDPDHRPENNALSTTPGEYPPGLFVTRDPEHWYNGKDYVRPFVAEVHGPDDLEAGRWGNESFLPAERFGEAQVKRVLPYDAWANEHFNSEPYQGADVRQMSPEEHAQQFDATNQYIRDNRAHMLSYPCSSCGSNETWNECQSCGQREDPGLDAYQQRGYMPQFKGTGEFYKQQFGASQPDRNFEAHIYTRPFYLSQPANFKKSGYHDPDDETQISETIQNDGSESIHRRSAEIYGGRGSGDDLLSSGWPMFEMLSHSDRRLRTRSQSASGTGWESPLWECVGDARGVSQGEDGYRREVHRASPQASPTGGSGGPRDFSGMVQRVPGWAGFEQSLGSVSGWDSKSAGVPEGDDWEAEQYATCPRCHQQRLSVDDGHCRNCPYIMGWDGFEVLQDAMPLERENWDFSQHGYPQQTPWNDPYLSAWQPEGWDAPKPYSPEGDRCPMCKNHRLISMPSNTPNTPDSLICPECNWAGERAPDWLREGAYDSSGNWYDEQWQGDRDNAEEWNEHGDFRIGETWYDGSDGDRLAKLAHGGPIMYHVAPNHAHESIKQHGIDWAKGVSPWDEEGWQDEDYDDLEDRFGEPVWRGADVPNGNFLYSDLDHAHDYGGRLYGDGYNVYQVNAAGLPLTTDPETQPTKPWEQGASDNRWFTNEPIGPERIQGYAPGLHPEEARQMDYEPIRPLAKTASHESVMRLMRQVDRGQRVNYRPREWHRSFTHPETGQEWIWPEADGEHEDMAQALGLDPYAHYETSLISPRDMAENVQHGFKQSARDLVQIAVPPPQKHPNSHTRIGNSDLQLPHLLLHDKGEPARGIIEGNGRIHTWPEDWGTHGAYAQSNDLTNWTPFYLTRDGKPLTALSRPLSTDQAQQVGTVVGQPVRYSNKLSYYRHNLSSHADKGLLNPRARTPYDHTLLTTQLSHTNTNSDWDETALGTYLTSLSEHRSQHKGRTSRSPYCCFCDRSPHWAPKVGTQGSLLYGTAPRVLYHHTWEEVAPQIEQEGLKPDPDQAGGVYLTSKPRTDRSEGNVTYEVNVEGLPIEPDETTPGYEANFPDEQWYVHYDTIPPERLRRIAGQLGVPEDSPYGLGPEAGESYPHDFTRPPSHVFRTMSEEHYQKSLQEGVHQSDERGNYLGQAAKSPEDWVNETPEPEGTVAGRWAYPGYLMNSPDKVGRIVKIRVEPEDGWEPHPDDEEQGYWRTFQPIPVDRFEAATEPIDSQTWTWRHSAFDPKLAGPLSDGTEGGSHWGTPIGCPKCNGPADIVYDQNKMWTPKVQCPSCGFSQEVNGETRAIGTPVSDQERDQTWEHVMTSPAFNDPLFVKPQNWDFGPARHGSRLRTAMALTPEQIETWIAENGPYLYHGAHPRGGGDPEAVTQSILERGIVPNFEGRIRSDYPGYRDPDTQWDDAHDQDLDEWWHHPRPGHVFMVSSPDQAYGNPLFRIDMRKLDPTKLKADDDSLRDNHPDKLRFHKYTEPTPENPPATLGDQAQEIGWGEDPTETMSSLAGSGVVAYEGAIPPEALTRVASGSLSPDNGSGQRWFHTTDALLNPGDEVIPAAERGAERSHPEATQPYDANSVYVWTPHISESLLENWGQHTYEVQPLGPLSPDPEANPSSYDYPEDDPAHNSYVTPRARVIRKLEPPEVDQIFYGPEASSHLGSLSKDFPYRMERMADWNEEDYWRNIDPKDPWPWQQGHCGTYACALMQEYPHLRFGVLNDVSSGAGTHFFAHDDTHAYDSFGRHPLPYLGIRNQWHPDEMELNSNPSWYGVPDDEAGPQGSEVNIERALNHIRATKPLETDWRPFDQGPGVTSAVDPQLFDLVYRALTGEVGKWLNEPEPDSDPRRPGSAWWSILEEIVHKMSYEFAPNRQPTKEQIMEAINMALPMVRSRQGEGPAGLQEAADSPRFIDPGQYAWDQLPEGLEAQIPGYGDGFPSYVGDPRFPARMRWTHVTAPVHSHLTTGLPCTCPWGNRPDARTLAKTASKIEWLKERNDKFMRTPEGQNAFDSLAYQVASNPKLDALAPWLWREIKKGRIQPGGRTFYAGDERNPVDLNHLADWYESNSPTRRGTDIMQLDVHGMQERINAWNDELAAKMDQERQMEGTVMHDFTNPGNPTDSRNGWTIRRIDNQEQASNEGDAMGHCVGGYGRDVENGNVGIFSLRDPKNQPHATIEIKPNQWEDPDPHDYRLERDRPKSLVIPDGGLVHQIQGKQNMEPQEEYRDMLRDWFGQVPDLGANVEKTVVPTPTDPDGLNYWYEPEDDYGQNHYQLSPDQAYEYGLGDDEDRFEFEGPPDWDKIIHSYLHADGYQRGSPRYGPEVGHDIRDIAHETGYEDQFKSAVENHRQELAKQFYREIYDPKQYAGTAPTQWDQWPQGAKMNLLRNVRSSLPYDPQELPLGDGASHEISPDQQKLFTEQWQMQPNQTWQDVPDGPKPYYNYSKTADVEGYTNWDTKEVASYLNNDREMMDAQDKMVAEGWTPDQIRDWCLQHIVGPHNKDAIAAAKEWNSIPEDERVDHHYEDFKDKHGDKPGAMDLLHGLAGGPDVSDSEPTLIDPELVNWHELHQEVNGSAADNEQYGRDEQALLDSGIDFGGVGSDIENNQMRDAMYKFHGAKPDRWFKERGTSVFTGPDAQYAYHNINVNIPYEHFKNWTGFPDHYLPGGQDTARYKIWSLRYNKAYNAALENLQTRHPDVDPNYLKEVAERSYRDYLPEGRKLDDNVNLSDPEERTILEADPLHQGWVQNGYTMRLHDFADDLIGDIQRGRPNPYRPQMEQALAQQGHAPEAIPQIMRQRWQWDPETQQHTDLDPAQPAPPADPSLDQPGNTFLPEGWTASRRLPPAAHQRSSRPGESASLTSSAAVPAADDGHRRSSLPGSDGLRALPRSAGPEGPPQYELSWQRTLSRELERRDQDQTERQREQDGIENPDRLGHVASLADVGERVCDHCTALIRDPNSANCWACGHRLIEDASVRPQEPRYGPASPQAGGSPQAG